MYYFLHKILHFIIKSEDKTLHLCIIHQCIAISLTE